MATMTPEGINTSWFWEGRLVLPPGLEFEEWQAVGESLKAMERSVQWWLGDWWRFGERHYGEAAAQAAPTGFAVQTLQNCAWVAEKIEPSRRRSDLPFGHHEVVAALEPQEQDDLLQRAAEGNWSRAELRGRVRVAQGKEESSVPCVCERCGNSHYRTIVP